MKYKWLLFDADGTLFDYDKAEKTALKNTFEFYQITFESHFLNVYRKINDKIWKAFERGEITQEDIKTKRFEYLFEELEIKLPSLEFSEKYLTNLGQGAFLLDGAENLLESLKDQFGLVIITNGLKKVQRSRLRHSTISHFFTDVIISEEVGFAKPDPGIFDVTFDKLGNPQKNEVLIIGDSLTSDIMGGYQYGIDTCWYNPSAKENHSDISLNFEIQKLDDVLSIVAENKRA